MHLSAIHQVGRVRWSGILITIITKGKHRDETPSKPADSSALCVDVHMGQH